MQMRNANSMALIKTNEDANYITKDIRRKSSKIWIYHRISTLRGTWRSLSPLEVAEGSSPALILS